MATPTTGPVPYIDAAVAVLMQANIAIPIIFATVGGIVKMINAARGSSPEQDLDVLANLMEAQLDENAAKGKAEIARLKAEIAASHQEGT